MQTKLLNFINYFKHWINFDKYRSLRKKLIEINTEKDDFYDYGENFFYQDMPCINLPGLRNTSKRIDALDLNNLLSLKTFLDIGSNVGSIILNLETKFIEGVGIEYNPKLVKIAKTVAEEKNIHNLKFLAEDFLKYQINETFDVVLSLANHSTFDKGINDTKLYFEKIDKLLKKNGILVLESHSPLYEPPLQFEEIVEKYCKKYKILKEGIYKFGNFYDLNRKFYILRK